MASESSEEIAARFDERAASYDESVMHRLLAAEVAAFAHLSGVREVVDVATGTGLVLRALAPLLEPGARMTGVDLSAGMLAVARRELPEAQFIQCNALAIPFDNASVDLVTCVTGLHLMPDPVAAMFEWARVLRPAGRIVIATFTGQTRYGSLVSVDEVADAAGLTVLRSMDTDTDDAAEHGHEPLIIAELANG